MPPFNALLSLVSEESSAALRQGMALAGAVEAPLYLLPIGTATPDTVKRALRAANDLRDSDDLDTRLLPSTEEQLDKQVQHWVDGNNVSIVVADTPSDRGPVPPLATASATKTLLNTLDCSVFVVEQNRDPSSIRRILVPTDLSDDTPAVFDGAAALADAYDASIDVLHVIEAVPYVALTRMDRLSLSSTSFPEHRARHRLSTLLDKSALSERSVERHFEYGDPADQIGRFVNRHEIDLLVLAPNNTDASPRTSLGSVSDRVLRRMTCPVVVVRLAGPAPQSQASPPSRSETSE